MGIATDEDKGDEEKMTLHDKYNEIAALKKRIGELESYNIAANLMRDCKDGMPCPIHSPLICEGCERLKGAMSATIGTLRSILNMDASTRYYQGVKETIRKVDSILHAALEKGAEDGDD